MTCHSVFDSALYGMQRVICGNSLQESTFATLMGSRRANVVVTDPPYNVKIDGNDAVKVRSIIASSRWHPEK